MNSSDYKIKLIRLEDLLKQLTTKGKLNKATHKELDQLSDQIQEYEEKNYPFKVESLKEMIELRMYQRKLKQKDLAEILGTTPSRISEILNGKRSLTLDLARGLYRKLNIDADLILQG
ncbi:MAG: transcriptional regulator [Bacteroidetes bacterium]|nr:MAG: transcriptional regulator [Bacteroidota bacterium]